MKLSVSVVLWSDVGKIRRHPFRSKGTLGILLLLAASRMRNCRLFFIAQRTNLGPDAMTAVHSTGSPPPHEEAGKIRSGGH